ncbi:hypothetical protein O1M54_27230 [Streptomyces diastatochromogenes]|nr:hypothetical protein [Streptomyces diastatochromogenes]
MFTLSVRQRRRVLVADLVSTAVFPLAITGATAAVPDVSAQLPGPAALGPWIVLAYNGLFAAALLLAGATVDRGTRTRFFAVGNIVVAATGLFSALAPDLPSLVALRAVGGIGAAMQPPADRRWSSPCTRRRNGVGCTATRAPCWAAVWRWARSSPRPSWPSEAGPSSSSCRVPSPP